MSATASNKDPNVVTFDAQNRVMIPTKAKPIANETPVDFPIITWLTLDERKRILIFFGSLKSIIEYAREQAAERQLSRTTELIDFYLSKRECVTTDERGRLQISSALRNAANLQDTKTVRLGHLGSCLYIERLDRNDEWYLFMQNQLASK